MIQPRIALRTYSKDDHARALAWLQDPGLRRCLGTTRSPTVESHQLWFQRMQRRSDVRLYAIYREDRHIGNLYVVDIDSLNERAEVQLFIGDNDKRNQGAGTVALKDSLRICFAELGLHRVFALVFAFNERAVRTFVKAGFAVEGRFRAHRKRDGKYHDMIVLGCLADDG